MEFTTLVDVSPLTHAYRNLGNFTVATRCKPGSILQIAKNELFEVDVTAVISSNLLVLGVIIQTALNETINAVHRAADFKLHSSVVGIFDASTDGAAMKQGEQATIKLGFGTLTGSQLDGTISISLVIAKFPLKVTVGEVSAERRVKELSSDLAITPIITNVVIGQLSIGSGGDGDISPTTDGPSTPGDSKDTERDDKQQPAPQLTTAAIVVIGAVAVAMVVVGGVVLVKTKKRFESEPLDVPPPTV